MKRKEASFVRSAGLISALTLLSRILGLVREAICAYYFGASDLWGDFSIAFRIPNLSRRLFGEGALSAAFIPVLSRRLQADGRQSGQTLTGGVLLLLSTVLLGLVLLGEGILWLARQQTMDHALGLTAVMLPYMFFICAVALLAGAQNVIGRFAVPALMPILFNVMLIAGIVAGHWWSRGQHLMHIYIVALTVLVSGVVQLLLQWWALRRAGFGPTLIWNPRLPDIRRIVGTMAPMVIGLAALQLNSLADLVVAKLFVAEGGGAAVLSYGERLYQLPVGLFGAALATAIFPALSRLAHGEDRSALVNMLQRGVRLALFVGIPASIGLIAVSDSAVGVIYQRGAFDVGDTQRVSKVVACYASGVWAYVALQVLIRGYYALEHTTTPMRVAGAMVLVNLMLNLILVQFFAEAGIAIATALCAAVQAVALMRLFSQTGVVVTWKVLGSGTARVVAASVVMGLCVWGLERLLVDWGTAGTGRALLLLIQIAAGVLVFLGVAKLLGCDRELRR